jgi:UTP--glucose-1-phosphate uridylyltransferase
MPISKAIIPAAGLGTRFLPATKSVPKEMLPVVDKPVLQYVIEEALDAGIDDILIVTGRGKAAIENHFDRNPELEYALEKGGKTALLTELKGMCKGAKIHYIRQPDQAGLGDAIRLGREHVGDEPFAVLLGDTIITHPAGKPSGMRQLVSVFDAKQGNGWGGGVSVVAVRPVPKEWTSRYGIVDGHVAAGDPSNLWVLKRLVEKPAPDKAPTNLAIAGRYVFTPALWDFLETTGRGVGNEIQLTDAMNTLAQHQPVYALAWNATRYDIGNKLDYAKCFLDLALARADIGPALREHLKGLVT